MRFGDIADDREAETEAAVNPRGWVLALPERLENIRQKNGLDAFTTVGNADADLRIVTLDRYLDRAALRRELDGIRKEIPHDLLKPRRIDHDRSDRRSDLRRHGDRARIGARSDRVDRRSDDR